MLLTLRYMTERLIIGKFTSISRKLNQTSNHITKN